MIGGELWTQRLCLRLCNTTYNGFVIRKLSLDSTSFQIQKMTRLRVVDDSAIGKQAMLEGKPPKCIQVYTKTGFGTIGDKVMVAIKGQKKRGYIVGVKQIQKHSVPRFDSNNLVLIDDDGSPLGTRIHAPIPVLLRGRALAGDFAKIIAIATRFV